jgi:diguanylate cyclase (GGDEF)-like protein
MADVEFDKKSDRERDYYEATRDVLTSFVNRQVLIDALQRSISRARRGKRTTLIAIDIDNFKLVNQAVGEDDGDKVLQDVTAVLKNWLRDEDMLARLGSDEFAALLEGEGPDGAEVAAERMRAAVQGYKDPNWNFSLSLSIGVVAVTGAADPETILRWGDTAMYEAQKAGGNKVVRFKPGAGE